MEASYVTELQCVGHDDRDMWGSILGSSVEGLGSVGKGGEGTC